MYICYAMLCSAMYDQYVLDRPQCRAIQILVCSGLIVSPHLSSQLENENHCDLGSCCHGSWAGFGIVATSASFFVTWICRRGTHES